MEKFPYTKEAKKTLKERIVALGEEIGLALEIKDTPDTITIAIKDAKGNIIKEFGFLRKEKIPTNYGNDEVELEKIIEARLLFPDDDPDAALKKIEALKQKRD
ncbi:MAG: hypothetical protein AAB432_03180 [Patescibacteria group bacterium]